MTIHLANLADLRALGRGSNTIPPPDFFIPLTSSLALSRGVGSPTFTRNTTATVHGYDNSGNWTLLTIPSGTPRFEGARWTGSAWTDTFPDGSKIPDATLKGYLAEGQRTNLLTYSEQFDNAAWTKWSSGVVANATTAPDRTLTADKIYAITLNDSHIIYQSNSINSGLSYTFSIYLEKAEQSWLQVSLGLGAFGADTWVNVNLDTGAVGNHGSSGSWSVQRVVDGWYRVSLTGTATATGTNISGAVFLTNNTDSATRALAHTGDGTSGIYLWGAQLEQASFASSYAATTNTTTTRNADVLSYLSSLFSDTAGTAYVELTPLSWANVAGGILGDGSNKIIAPSYAYGAYAYDGVNTANGPSMSPTGKVKAVIRWGNGKMRIFVNGVAGAESNYNGAFSLSSLLIGNNFYGNIKNVKSWYNRILSDYQCQRMTA